MTQATLYWHDYETFGIDPSWDRPAQFAGIRTDEELNVISDPLVIYCRPGLDMLPSPEACLITGITPQHAFEHGHCEAEFMQQIHAQMSQENTCSVGYNSIRFDDEFTRHSLYRNFYDAYAREWKNGNSRWDIIDMVRMSYALRPEGIEWPTHEDGTPSFKLEDLTKANNIEHLGAHDALSDVTATIAVAKLIKMRQPKLYDFLYSRRKKTGFADLLNPVDRQILIHTSAMFPATQGCTSLIAPITLHPVNKNAVICWDLRHDPSLLADLTIEELHERTFTRTENLAEGTERIALKGVHLNKSPAIAPFTKLSEQTIQRLQLDMAVIEENFRTLNAMQGIEDKIKSVYELSSFEASDDPDLMLYSGSFFSGSDRQSMDQVIKTDPSELATLKPYFEDARLYDLFLRYRGRNYPETLSDDDKAAWLEYCDYRLHNHGLDNKESLDSIQQKLSLLAEEMELDDKAMDVLESLAEYTSALELTLSDSKDALS